MAGPWEKYSQQAREALTPSASGPWTKYAAAPGEAWKALDFSRPVEDLRPEIEKLPSDQKEKALQAWADREVAQRPAELPRAAEKLPIIGGLLDEASAGINAGIAALTNNNFGQPYDEGLALERARQRRTAEEMPGTDLAVGIAGGVAGFGPVMGTAARVGDKVLGGIASRVAGQPVTVNALSRGITPAQTTLGRMGQGAAIGAPLAAVEGFTRGEGGVGERLEAAKDTGLVGAGLGAAFPLAANLATRGYGAVADVVAPTAARLRSGPDAAAHVILARRIQNPQAVLDDLAAGREAARLGSNSQAQLPETIADTSDDLQRLLGSTYRAGGAAGDFVEDTLNARQRGPVNPFAKDAAEQLPGQRQRVLDTTQRTLLIKGAQSARATDKELMRDQARKGRELYKEAYENSEAFDIQPVLDAWETTAQNYPGPFAARLRRAMNLFSTADKGKKGAADFKPGFRADNIQRFDAAKKALDDEISKAKAGGQGNLARELQGMKDDLLAAVHKPDADGNATRNITYDTARKTWGSAAENREAIELGKSALKEGSEVSAEMYTALSPGQQTLFRIGFMADIKRALGRTRPGNDATLLFQEPRVQELMRVVIPQTKGKGVFANRGERYGELMRREGRMTQTRNKALGGSPTAGRQQDDMTLAGDVARSWTDRFRQSQSLFQFGMEAVGAAAQKFFGFRQDVALSIARRLLEADPAEQQALLKALQARGGPSGFTAFMNVVDSAAAQATPAMSPTIADLQKGGN